MTRFTWLQARAQTIVALAGLLIVAIVVGLTGPHLSYLYDHSVAHCGGVHLDCSIARDSFLRNDKTLDIWLGILVIVTPVLLGLFWGAPLIARELETGTYRLAWTQSVTRTHWLAVKLAFVTLVSMVVAGLLSLLVSWWASPLDVVKANRFAVPFFDERGIVAIGYAAFATTLGIAAGLLIRRTVPAMATTLAVFVAVRLATIGWLRPHFIAPLHRASRIDPSSVVIRTSDTGAFSLLPPTPHLPNAWIFSSRFADASGRRLTHRFLAEACRHVGAAVNGPPRGSGNARQASAHFDRVLNDCYTKLAAKYHVVATYQPARRYWTFQGIELAVFVGAALLLTAFCFWWIRRRLT